MVAGLQGLKRRNKRKLKNKAKPNKSHLEDYKKRKETKQEYSKKEKRAKITVKERRWDPHSKKVKFIACEGQGVSAVFDKTFENLLYWSGPERQFRIFNSVISMMPPLQVEGGKCTSRQEVNLKKYSSLKGELVSLTSVFQGRDSNNHDVYFSIQWEDKAYRRQPKK